jgi:hypothetical protein
MFDYSCESVNRTPHRFKVRRTGGQLVLVLVLFLNVASMAQPAPEPFRVLAFFTAERDRAHITFVHEANQWFAEMAGEYGFTYDSTSNWQKLNDQDLVGYQVVLFPDTRPALPEQRNAFQPYVEKGGLPHSGSKSKINS